MGTDIFVIARALDLIRHVFNIVTRCRRLRTGASTRPSTRVEHLPSISKQKCEFSSPFFTARASHVGNINSYVYGRFEE